MNKTDNPSHWNSNKLSPFKKIKIKRSRWEGQLWNKTWEGAKSNNICLISFVPKILFKWETNLRNGKLKIHVWMQSSLTITNTWKKNHYLSWFPAKFLSYCFLLVQWHQCILLAQITVNYALKDANENYQKYKKHTIWHPTFLHLGYLFRRKVWNNCCKGCPIYNTFR